MSNDRIVHYFDEIMDEAHAALNGEYHFAFEKALTELTPIEQLLFLALFHKSRILFISGWDLTFRPQFEIGKYRVDFQISLSNHEGWESNVIVECDGHDFHEKTKQQVESDKKRERELQAAGYHVLRFSGTEIWRDPSECVDEIGRFLVMNASKNKKDHSLALAEY